MGINENIGENIRKIRKKYKYTIKEFAPLIGMTESNLSYLERGKITIKAEYIAIISQKIKEKKNEIVSANEFYTGIIDSGDTFTEEDRKILNQINIISVKAYNKYLKEDKKNK